MNERITLALFVFLKSTRKYSFFIVVVGLKILFAGQKAKKKGGEKPKIIHSQSDDAGNVIGTFMETISVVGLVM